MKKARAKEPELPAPVPVTTEVLIGTHVVHPYLTVVPEMTKDDYDALVERTRESGQILDITLDPEGQVLRGREQLRACLDLGIEPVTKTSTRNEPAWEVIDSLRGPKLSHAQHALIAARLLGPLKAEAKARQAAGKAGENFAEGRATDIAAKIVGKTNEKYVDLAVDLIADPKKPEIIKLIESGKLRRMSHAKTLAGFAPAKYRRSVERIDNGEEPSFVLRESKPSDDLWLTPENIVIAVRAAFDGKIMCDPCAPLEKGSYVDAEIKYTEKDNGLTKPWPDRTFVNPPFSKAREWVPHAIKQHTFGQRMFLLLPIRPDSDHQQLLFDEATDILLLDERVSFGKPDKAKKGTGKISIMIAAFGCTTQDLVEAGLEGKVVMTVRPADADMDEKIERWKAEVAAAGEEELVYGDGPPITAQEEAEVIATANAVEAERSERFARSRTEIAEKQQGD